MAAGWKSVAFGRWLLGRFGSSATVPPPPPSPAHTCLTGTGSLTTALTGTGGYATPLTGTGTLTTALTGTGGDCS